MAHSAALDGILPAPGQFHNTDNSKQILFPGDSGYMDDKATAANLQGNSWGMMNEPGGYAGLTWLAPFSFWYQLPIFNSEAETGPAATLTSNGDIYVFAIIGVFMLLPFIRGLRDVPRWIPVHKLVWKQYYRDSAARKSRPTCRLLPVFHRSTRPHRPTRRIAGHGCRARTDLRRPRTDRHQPPATRTAGSAGRLPGRRHLGRDQASSSGQVPQRPSQER
jgi:hypothetical protein